MELVQKTIQSKEIKQAITHQFRLGEDMNVPDSKDDISRILQSYGKLNICKIERRDQYLQVRGVLEYQIMYATDYEEKRISCLEGTLQVDEMVYVEAQEDEQYTVKCNQLEFQGIVIHSRKVNLKALVEIEIQKSMIRQEEITIDVEDELEYSFHKKYGTTPILELSMAKQDTYRIKEEIKLPGTKENIGELLLTRIGNIKLDSRSETDEIMLHGEFQFFCMYLSDEWKEDYIAQTVAFEGRFECNGMEESMIHRLRYTLGDVSIDTQMDEDGEIRILNIEATLNMDLEVYEEKEYEILEDMYILEKKCSLTKKSIYMETLVLQNQSKCKLIETLMLPELKDDLLQICTANGMIQMEGMDVREGAIEIEGILHVNMLYIREDDRCPYASWQGMIPFIHRVECPRETELSYNVDAYLEQISISMAGNGEIEVKSVMNFHGFIRKPVVLEVIQEVVEEDYSREELEEQAGIIGYIYKDSDNIWDVAKKFHTTTEGILKNNKIDEKEIKAGQKLLIFKENISIL